MSDKNIYRKIKYFLASSSNDRGLSLDDQTKDYVDRNTGGQVYSLHEVTTRVIFTMKICIFERSNEKNHFSKTKIYFHKKTTPQLLGHTGLQNMKVGVRSNFGQLVTIFQICAMDADILSEILLSLP